MRKIRQARVRVSTPAAPLGDIQNYAADEGRGYTQAQAQQPHLAKFELPRCARRSCTAPWQSAFVAHALCVCRQVTHHTRLMRISLQSVCATVPVSTCDRETLQTCDS